MVRPPPPGTLNWSKAMRKAIIRLLVALNPYIMALAPYTGGMRSYNWPLLVNMVFDWFKPAPVVKPVPVAIYVGDTFDCLPPAVGFVVDTELPTYPMPEPMPAPEPMPEPVAEVVPAPLPMPAPALDLSALKVPALRLMAKERGIKGYGKMNKATLIEAITAHDDSDVRLAG